MTFDISILLLKAPSNRRVDVEPLMPQVNELIPTLKQGIVTHISG